MKLNPLRYREGHDVKETKILDECHGKDKGMKPRMLEEGRQKKRKENEVKESLLFLRSFISSFVHFFIRSFVHSFICPFIHSFIHSGHFYSAPSSPLPLRGAPDYSTDTVSEFHAEAHKQL